MRVCLVDGIQIGSGLACNTAAGSLSDFQRSPQRPQTSLSYAKPFMDGISRQVKASQVASAVASIDQVFGSILPTPTSEIATTLQRNSRFGLIAAPIAVVLLSSAIVPLGIRWQHARVTQSKFARSVSSNVPARSVAKAITPVSIPKTIAASFDISAMQGILDTFATSQAATYGIVVQDLTTGTTVTHNPDQIMTSASLYKLFIAAEVYRRVDAGTLSLGGEVQGSSRNVAECLSVMITVSDNDCGNALGALVGWGAATDKARDLGFTNTDLRAFPMHTTATDISRLFERLYGGTLLSPSSTQSFLSLLKDQRVNNRLPIGLPAGTIVAHKTGDLFNAIHDAGIVYSPKSTYLITVMSDNWSSPGNAPAGIATLSKQVYNLLNQ